MFLLSLIAFLSLAAWLYLVFGHGRFWQLLLPKESEDLIDWPAVTVVVPARNEAATLPDTLPALLNQNYPGDWRIILVDDGSEDDTEGTARQIANQLNKSGRVTVIRTDGPREGWSGKVSAMQTGFEHASGDYILFTDADIWHPTKSLRHLVVHAVTERLDLASLMVKLHCGTLAERLLIPAFVYFFAMLYPFRWSNDPYRLTAAAAGGVMLVARRALDNIGGFTTLRDAIIDDCTLAKAIKRNRADTGRISLTLSGDTHSFRVYEDVRAIWTMIKRSAYTQLDYEPRKLAWCIVGMALVFLAPPLLFLSGAPFAAIVGLAAWALMIFSYVPMVRFYHLSPVWALTLPLAVLIYLGATLDSARAYRQGKGGQWKGRAQAS